MRWNSVQVPDLVYIFSYNFCELCLPSEFHNYGKAAIFLPGISFFYAEEKPDTLSFDVKSVHIQYISFYNSFLNIFCTLVLQSSLY